MPESLFVQYGSFGLVALMFIWFITKGFPQVLATISTSLNDVMQRHDKHVAVLMASFEAEERESRRERLAAIDVFRQEREADRMARHSDREAFQAAIAAVFNQLHDHGRPKPPTI